MELFPFVLLNIVYNMMKINFPIFCDSAGVLLPPPAEAQQWKGDPTEQRGRRWETAQQHQAEAGKQSKTSIKVQNWEQTWDDLTKWSSHCGPKQRSSRWKNRWVNPKARPVLMTFTMCFQFSLHSRHTAFITCYISLILVITLHQIHKYVCLTGQNDEKCSTQLYLFSLTLWFEYKYFWKVIISFILPWLHHYKITWAYVLQYLLLFIYFSNMKSGISSYVFSTKGQLTN